MVERFKLAHRKSYKLAKFFIFLSILCGIILFYVGINDYVLEYLIYIGLVFAIVYPIIIYVEIYTACVFYNIAADKGYTEAVYFNLSFYLTIVGYLAVIALPYKSLHKSLHKSLLTQVMSKDEHNAGALFK